MGASAGAAGLAGLGPREPGSRTQDMDYEQGADTPTTQGA